MNAICKKRKKTIYVQKRKPKLNVIRKKISAQFLTEGIVLERVVSVEIDEVRNTGASHKVMRSFTREASFTSRASEPCPRCHLKFKENLLSNTAEDGEFVKLSSPTKSSGNVDRLCSH